jgi:hypothetical protein
MFYPLSDGRYHVFLWYDGGSQLTHEEFDTPGEAGAFIHGLKLLDKSGRRCYCRVLTLEEYSAAKGRE